MKLVYLLAISASVLAIQTLGCAGAQILTPSELNADPNKYDDQKVHLRGWVVIEFEEYHIWDSKAAHDKSATSSGMASKECISYLGSTKNRMMGRMEILYGTFWKDFAKSLNAVDMGTCNGSGLDVDKQELIGP